MSVWHRIYTPVLALLPWVYLGFLASFFLSTSDKFTNNLFYLALLGFLVGPAVAMLRALAQLPLGQLLLGYLAYHLLAVAWSEALTAEIWRQQVMHSLYVLGFVLMGLWTLRTPQDVKLLFQALTGAALISGVLILGQAIRFGLPPEGRLSGWEMLSHPGLAATIYGSLWLWWLAQPSAPRTWVQVGVLLGLGGFIVLTQSRGPLLALLISVGLWWLLRRKFWWLAGVALLGLGYTALAWSGLVDWPTFLQRHGWDSYRLEIWRLAWRDIQAAPFFGHGSATVLDYPVTNGRLEPHPHSLYLTAWVRGGVLELVLLLALLGCTLRAGWDLWRRTGDASLFLQLGFATGCGLTDGAGLIHHPMPFWLYFWLPVTRALGELWYERR